MFVNGRATHNRCMRRMLATALWLYLGWYAGALVAQVLPVPGELGLAAVAIVLVIPAVRPAEATTQPLRESPAQARH